MVNYKNSLNKSEKLEEFNLNIDVMLDIETLGKQDNTAIFQIYAEAFDRKTFKTISSIELLIDITTINPSLIEMNTLYWWTQNHPELFKQLTTVTDKHISEGMAAAKLHMWLKYELPFEGTTAPDVNNIYVWGNGSVFDNIKIKNFLQRNSFDYPIFYKNDQDLRSVLRTASEVSGKSEEEIKKLAEFEGAVDHDAKDDVKFQINILKRCDELVFGKELFSFDQQEEQ